MGNKKERELIYLASMLHNIGKFYQRSEFKNIESGNFSSHPNKEKELFHPLLNMERIPKHCLWTAQFIDEHKSIFNKLLNIDTYDLSEKNNLINLAACYHLKNEDLSELGQIIKEADCLSFGMDRDSDEAIKDSQDCINWNSYIKKRLSPIFERIGKSNKTDRYQQPVKSISLSKDFFPKKTFNENPDFKILWEDFLKDFTFIQKDTCRAFSETLLNLFYKYTCCIPASTVNYPDISLYDHSKTTAALSICLYDFLKSREDNKNPFLLIGADFSGIQSYIYQIISKYAGKSLKGRSFYLQLLSDAVVRFILKELDLFQANIIYNSGGGFYIIAPNTKNIRDRLSLVIEKIEQHFLKSYGNSIFVALEYTEISKDALYNKNGQNLKRIWTDLFNKRDRKKENKLAIHIKKDYTLFFEPFMQGGDTKRDKITGEEFLKGEKIIEKENDLFLKKSTYQQIKLGEFLRDMDFLIVSEGEIKCLKNSPFLFEPGELGFYYYFLNKNKLATIKEDLTHCADNVSIISYNGKCGSPEDFDGLNIIYGFAFYGGNEFNGKSFDEMCEGEKFSRLGVLRMDVDNLGSIFQTGFSSEGANLSRYYTLSRSFDYFFSGYLNTIWKEIAPDKSFIIYSGGDDVFIVGSWEITIKIAKRIREDFKEFTCEHNDFSLSGGIAILPSKYPIMRGAKESEQEEHNAKNHLCKGKRKNAISFLNMPLNWDEELPQVETLMNKIVHLIETSILPKSFISKIMIHAANSKIENHALSTFRIYWLLPYDLGRMKERTRNTEATSLLNNCILEICGKKKTLNGLPISTDYHMLELWQFACRWAEIELRSKIY